MDYNNERLRLLGENFREQNKVKINEGEVKLEPSDHTERQLRLKDKSNVVRAVVWWKTAGGFRILFGGVSGFRQRNAI